MKSYDPETRILTANDGVQFIKLTYEEALNLPDTTEVWATGVVDVEQLSSSVYHGLDRFMADTRGTMLRTYLLEMGKYGDKSLRAVIIPLKKLVLPAWGEVCP